jgi:hypothetical protein
MTSVTDCPEFKFDGKGFNFTCGMFFISSSHPQKSLGISLWRPNEALTKRIFANAF